MNIMLNHAKQYSQNESTIQSFSTCTEHALLTCLLVQLRHPLKLSALQQFFDASLVLMVMTPGMRLLQVLELFKTRLRVPSRWVSSEASVVATTRLFEVTIFFQLLFDALGFPCNGWNEPLVALRRHRDILLPSRWLVVARRLNGLITGLALQPQGTKLSPHQSL